MQMKRASSARGDAGRPLCRSFHPNAVQKPAQIDDPGSIHVETLGNCLVLKTLPVSAASFNNPLKNAEHKCQDAS